MTQDGLEAERQRIWEENERKWNTNPHAFPIEYWRDREDMTQAELAIEANLSRETISAAERGIPVSQKTLTLIARALNINPAFIRINLIIPKQEEES